MVELIKLEVLESQVSLMEVELEVARKAVEQAKSSRQIAVDQLRKAEILSPIDGKILAINIREGEIAIPTVANIPGATLMSVANTANAFAEIEVDEADVEKIAIGQSAHIVPAALSDSPINGTLVKISSTAKQSAGQGKSFQVKVQLEKSRVGLFHPGMSCRAEISTLNNNSRKSLVVPIQAIKYDEIDPKLKKTAAYVLVKYGEKVQRKNIEIGASDDAYTAIQSGLRSGDVIVTGPYKTLRYLRDGENIKVIERSQKTDEKSRGR